MRTWRFVLLMAMLSAIAPVVLAESTEVSGKVFGTIKTSEGKPISGMELSLIFDPNRDDRSLEECWVLYRDYPGLAQVTLKGSAVTAEDGSFELVFSASYPRDEELQGKELPSDFFGVLVGHTAKYSAIDVLSLEDGCEREARRVDVAEVSQVKGRLVDGDTGEPIADREIVLVHTRSLEARNIQVRTDKDGRFDFPEVVSGEYDFRAKGLYISEGKVRPERTLRVWSGDEVDLGDLKAKDSGTVKFSVRNGVTAEPPVIAVATYSSWKPSETFCGGEYQIELPPGEHSLRTMIPGSDSHEFVGVVVSAGEVTDLGLVELVPNPDIRVVLEFPEGVTPPKDLWIWARRGKNRSYWYERKVQVKDGECLFPMLTVETRYFSVEGEGVAQNCFRHEVRPDTKDVALKVELPCKVRCNLLAPDGSRLRSSKLEVLVRSGSAAHAKLDELSIKQFRDWIRDKESVSAAYGAFTWTTDVPPGTYTFVCQVGGQALRLEDCEVTLDGSNEFAITMPSGSVSLTLKDERGPLRNSAVILLPHRLEYKTDDDGLLQIANAPAGRSYLIRKEASEHFVYRYKNPEIRGLMDRERKLDVPIGGTIESEMYLSIPGTSPVELSLSLSEKERQDVGNLRVFKALDYIPSHSLWPELDVSSEGNLPVGVLACRDYMVVSYSKGGHPSLHAKFTVVEGTHVYEVTLDNRRVAGKLKLPEGLDAKDVGVSVHSVPGGGIDGALAKGPSRGSKDGGFELFHVGIGPAVLEINVQGHDIGTMHYYLNAARSSEELVIDLTGNFETAVYLGPKDDRLEIRTRDACEILATPTDDPSALPIYARPKSLGWREGTTMGTLPAGTWDITVRCFGYTTTKIKALEVKVDTRAEASFNLKPVPGLLIMTPTSLKDPEGITVTLVDEDGTDLRSFSLARGAQDQLETQEGWLVLFTDEAAAWARVEGKGWETAEIEISPRRVNAVDLRRSK